MPRFNGQRLVIGEQPPISFARLEKDLKTNRNAKMIQALLRNDINGVFLFFLESNTTSNGRGFIFPPGLSDEETSDFQNEFMKLFERYAKLANRRHG